MTTPSPRPESKSSHSSIRPSDRSRAPSRRSRRKARLRSAMLCSISLKNEVFTATIPLAPSVPFYLILADNDDKLVVCPKV